MTLILPALNHEYQGENAFILNTPDLHLSGDGYVCVIGKNGCGKSTFGAILAENSENSTVSKWYFLPQYLDRFLFAENIVEQLHNFLSQDIDEGRLKDLLSEFGFADAAGMLDFPFLLLSGGERRRIALVCVFYLQPSQLILDEPEIGVTAKENMVLQSKLNNLSVLNVRLILISHNYEFIRHSSDLICLDKGMVTRVGRTQDLIMDPEFNLREYGVRFEK